MQGLPFASLHSPTGGLVSAKNLHTGARGATLGELADVFRSVFGEFREPALW